MSVKKHKVFERLLQKSSANNADALYYRIYRLANKNHINFEVAMFYLATKHDISINRYLKEQPEIRAALQQIELGSFVPPKTSGGKNIIKQKNSTYKLNDLRFKSNPPIITNLDFKELKQSTEAYQLIYIFENSIRRFINLVLTKKYGKDWWDKTHYADDFKVKVKEHKELEENTPWAKRGNPHPLYFINFEDLAKILEKAKKNFKPYFSYMGKDMNENWLRIRIHDVNKTRRVVAHSNPVTSTILRDCKSDIERWLKQIPRVIKELK